MYKANYLSEQQMTNLNNFFAIGINYKKTDASVRGQFAISTDQYNSLLQKAKHAGLKEIFVLSTCNRTEIYGVANDASVLVNLLCSETSGDKTLFQQLCYTKKGKEAIEHIFSVGAGLDSQILGDYEIVGQMKQAVKFAKEKGFVGAFIERLFNTVLQSSKLIKNQTMLSGGTVSVSFAAIQFLKENVQDASNKNIIMIGAGKIGKNTCKNLIDYLATTNITLINRTEEKAIKLAGELGIRSSFYSNLTEEVQKADIVIVATNAEEPIILKNDLTGNGKKILIDLSIPNNIDPKAAELPHITLVNVDDLAKINDETLQKRMAEVPKAKAIIAGHVNEFLEWMDTRRYVPVIKAVKKKLQEMHSCEMFLSAYHTKPEQVNNQAIQKVVNSMAVKMRNRHQPGCNFIEAINDFMSTGIN